MSEPLDGGDGALDEMALVGGDVNVGEHVVVRVGDTVRRPVGPHTEAVDALLRHFEAVGFDGAPRALGRDERGREVLSFVEGEPALAAGSRRRSRALRARARCCGGCTTPRPGSSRRPTARVALRAARAAAAAVSVICHNDLFPPNVIFRDGSPVALIDWDLVRAGTAPLRHRVGGRTSGRRSPTTSAPGRSGSRPTGRASGCASSATRYGLDAAERRRAARRRRPSQPDGLRDPPALRRRAPAARLARDVGRGQRRRDPRAERLVRGAPRRTATIPRMSLEPITVVVTASGAPGTAALLRGLRENGERELRLVGTDMSERSVGRHLCDAFHLVPAGSDPGFAAAVRAIVEARGRRLRPAPVVVRSRGPRRASRHASRCPCSSRSPTRSSARTTRPRRTRSCTGSACPRPRSGGSTAPPRSRPRRASSATPTCRSASSRCSRRGRAASGSSTRRSTARTSC